MMCLMCPQCTCVCLNGVCYGNPAIFYAHSKHRLVASAMLHTKYQLNQSLEKNIMECINLE